MNSNQNNLYDTFKDRRNGGAFLLTILAFIGLLILGAVLGRIGGSSDWFGYFPELLLGIGIFTLVFALASWCRRRAQRLEQLRHGPLSRDELRVARSKLMKDQNPKKS
jgi:hypothetical protein